MPNEPRRQTQDLLLTCPEPQYRASQEATLRAITPSSTTTTTIVAAALTSTCIGTYVVPLDGNARGQVRQVKSFVLATTTATVDTAWTDTTGTTTLASWLPAEVPVRGTATGTTTTVISSPHASVTNEPDDVFNNKGLFLLGKGGTNAGGCYAEADFATSTGTFTTTPTMSAAGGDGSLYLLRALVRPEGPVDATITRKTVARRIVGFKDADAAVPITAEGSVGLTLPQRPLTASAGSATVATAPLEMGAILSDCYTETLDTGSTVSSATSTTVVAASGTGFTIGGFGLLHTGEAFQVLNKATNTLTVQSGVHTSGSVIASSVLYASSWYKPKTSDFRTRTFDLYRGGLFRQVFHGCMPTLDISVARDQVVTFALKYSAGDCVEYNIANPITSTTFPLPILDTTVPVDGKGARLCLDGVKVLVGDLKMSAGLKPMMRPSLSGMNQCDGYAMDLDPCTVSFTALADNDDIASFRSLVDRVHAGDTMNFLYQKGSAPKETFCIGIPALQFTKVDFSYDNGQGQFSVEAQATLPQAVRGNSFASTLPAVSLGWL
jgi:hypothetical protein